MKPIAIAGIVVAVAAVSVGGYFLLKPKAKPTTNTNAGGASSGGNSSTSQANQGPVNLNWLLGNAGNIAGAAMDVKENINSHKTL